jgi:hypothetical protein
MSSGGSSLFIFGGKDLSIISHINYHIYVHMRVLLFFFFFFFFLNKKGIGKEGKAVIYLLL